MRADRDQPKALLEMWGLLARYRWRFIVPAFAVCTAVLLVAYALPRKYRATATFERRTDIVLTEMSSRGATRAFTDPRATLTAEITGRPALEAVVLALEPRLRQEGVIRSDADRAALIDDLWRRVLVSWEVASPELDRARLEYVGSDPEASELIVNGLIEHYIARSREAMGKRLEESSGFFGQEVARHRAAIESLENKVLEYEIAHGELLPETPNNIQTKLAALHDSLADATSFRDAAAMRVRTLEQALADTPETLPTVVRSRNPAIAELERQYTELRKQLQEYTIELKMTEAHPDVAHAREQLARVEELLKTTEEEVVTQRQMAANPKRAELELQLTAAVGEQKAYSERVEALKRQVLDLDASTATLFEARSTHRKLNRDLAEAQRQLAFWEDNLRRIQMALTAETGNRGVQLDFLQPAQASRRPVSPDLYQVFAAALALGLVAGCAGVFLAHRTDETFTDPDALAREFDLPLYGGVSEVVTSRHRRLRRARQMVLVPANALAMAAILALAGVGLYFDLHRPEAIQGARSRLLTALFDATGPAPATAAEPGPNTD